MKHHESVKWNKVIFDRIKSYVILLYLTALTNYFESSFYRRSKISLTNLTKNYQK